MRLQIMCYVTLLKVYLKVRSHLTEPWILFEILHYILYNLSFSFTVYLWEFSQNIYRIEVLNLNYSLRSEWIEWMHVCVYCSVRQQDTVCFLDNINMSAGVFLSLFSVLLSDNKIGAGAGHSAQRAVHSVSRGVDDESRICYSPPTQSSSVWRASQCILLARDSTSHLPWNEKENNFCWTIVKKNIWQA